MKEFSDINEFEEFRDQDTIENVVNEINAIESPYQLDEMLIRIQEWENLSNTEAEQYKKAMTDALERLYGIKENDRPEIKARKQRYLDEYLENITDTCVSSQSDTNTLNDDTAEYDENIITSENDLKEDQSDVYTLEDELKEVSEDDIKEDQSDVYTLEDELKENTEETVVLTTTEENDKRAQCLETIKRTILEAEKAPVDSIDKLYFYMLDKRIDMKNAPNEQKEIVAAAIKKIADTQPKSPRLRLAYNFMMGTKIRNNEELKAAIAKDFPALSTTTKAPKEATEAKETTTETQNAPVADTPVDTNATRTKRITALASATPDNILEQLNNLRNIKLSNAPEDQKEIVAAAIKKVLEAQSTTGTALSHEKLKGIVILYNALGKTKATNGAELETVINSDFPSLAFAPKTKEAPQEPTDKKEETQISAPVSETTELNDNINQDNINQPTDNTSVNLDDINVSPDSPADSETTEQATAPTPVANTNNAMAKFLRANHISQIKQEILDEDEVYRDFATFLINHCLEDEKIKMNEASDDEKKVVAEAIQKVLIQHPKAQISRSGYSAMMGIPEPKNNRELLYAISRDFPSDSATSNTAEPNQTDTTTKLNDNLSGTKSSTDDVLPKGATDMSNDKKEDTSVYEDLRNLLINADRINPEDLKRGITAAINAVISNPQLSDYEYNIIRDALTKHTALLKEIAKDFNKEDLSTFQKALNYHKIKGQTIDMSSYETALATISTIAAQDKLSKSDIDLLQNAIAVIGSQNINTPQLLDNFKTINEKFPKEFEKACQTQFAKDTLPTKEFTSLYQEVTGKDFFVSATPTQEDANELSAILQGVAKQRQDEEDERARLAIEQEKEQERQARIRAEKEEEERKAHLEADFSRAWRAHSALQYFKWSITDNNLDKGLEQKVLDFIAKTFPDEYTTDKISQTLKTALETTTEFNDKQKSSLLSVANFADQIATEKETSRWAHISRLSADPNMIILSGIEQDDIPSFSAHDYIQDNINNNIILATYVPTEQRVELLKINDEIARKREAGLSGDDILDQFLVEMANPKRSVSFSPATIHAVSDIIHRAEELDKHRIELEKQQATTATLNDTLATEITPPSATGPTPEPEPEPEPIIPEPEPITIIIPDPIIDTPTDDECISLSDELYNSTTTDEYIASIEPLLDAESLKSSMALKEPMARDAQYDTCAKALDNPDWLIALKDTYEKDWMSLTDEPLPEDRKNAWQKIGIKTEEWIQGGKTERSTLSSEAANEKARLEDDINGIIKARLSTLKPDDITPENAYAWLHLAAGTDLEDKINLMVGKALYTYDQEHFGGKNSDALAANYETATKELKSYIQNPANAHNIMGEYYFTDEKDNAISAKKERQIKESVLEVAAELVAEDFAKNPLTGTNKEKADAIEKALKDKVAMLTCGQKRLTETQAVAGLGVHMAQAETFKNRIKTKFKNSTLYNNVNSRLTKLDEKLTKRYGKKYIMAKKVGKFVAKTGWNVTKGVAMFAAANAIAPGVGPAALIAYNTCKQWKSVQKQLSDTSLSKTQKTAILFGTGLMTLASAATAATGAIPALDKLGLNTPETLQNIGNTMSTLTGRIARVGAITLGNTLPNMVKGFGLHIKTKTLEKRIKAQSKQLKDHPTSTDDLKLMQDLMKQHQELQKQKSQNKQEIIEKAASAALGSFMGTIFGDSLNKLIHGGENTASTTAAAKEETTEIKETRIETKEAVVDSVKTETVADSLSQTQVVDSTSVAQQFSQETTDSVATSHSLADKVAAAQRAEAGDTTQTSAPTQASNETETKSETESKAETKAETKAEEKSEAKAEVKAEAKAETENKQPEAKVAEQHAKNFEAAKVEGTSGHGNMSAHNDTIRHLTNLGDSRFEDVNATAQNLSEHLGDKTNIAVIACRMAPTDVCHALGLTDTPATTHAMIDHLANHDLTPEQQQNLNNMLQEKFGNWYSNAETHGVAPTSHTGDNNDNNTNQGNTGAKEAAEGNKTNATTEATAKAAATAAATAAADQAAATTKAGAEQTTGAEFHKMDVAPTGDKTVDTLNAKYAVTNGLEGDAKASMKFEKLTEADAAQLGLKHDDSQPAQQQQQQQEQHPKGHATVEHRQTAHQQAQHRDDIPVEAAIPLVYGSAEWAVQQGYVIDWDLTRGLNHGGTINHGGMLSNHGYAAVYFNPHHPNDVILIPNDPIADRDLVKFESRQVLRTLQNANNGHGAGPYERSNNPFGLLTTVLRGSGHISTATSTEAKIMSRVAMGAAVLDGVHSILGHHHHKG